MKTIPRAVVTPAFGFVIPDVDRGQTTGAKIFIAFFTLVGIAQNTRAAPSVGPIYWVQGIAWEILLTVVTLFRVAVAAVLAPLFAINFAGAVLMEVLIA